MYLDPCPFSDVNQKSEKEKLKKKGSLEKDDKVRKVTMMLPCVQYVLRSYFFSSVIVVLFSKHNRKLVY